MQLLTSPEQLLTTPTLNDGPSPSNCGQPSSQFVHGFDDLDWNDSEEPPYPNNPRYPQLYHLLTITAQLIVGYYPHDTHTLGEHYIAWAPLTSSSNTVVIQ